MKRRAPRAFLESPRPLRFAHRGGAALAPENTLEAFELGRTLGCDFIETDVRLSADGHVVVFHDASVERTTNGQGMVSALTLSELQSLNAAHHFTGRDTASVPTFRALCEWMAQHPEVRVNVELKTSELDLAKGLLQLLDEYALHERVLVASGATAAIRAFRRCAKGRMATSAGKAEIAAFVAAVRTGLWRWLPVDYDALQIPIRYKGLHVCTPALVSAAHARGVQVHVWTIDDPAQMQSLLAMGVDGIMTDRPDLLTEVVESASPNSG